MASNLVAIIALPVPLLAAIDDWKWLIALVILAFSGLSSILEQMKNAKKKKQAAGAPANAQRRAPERPPNPQPPKTVEDELNEFLRRAAQRKGENPAPAHPQASEGTPMIQRKRQPQQKAQRPEKVRTLDRSISSTPDPPREKRIGDQQIGGLTSSLAERGDPMQSHLKNVFEHSLGTLGSTSVASAPAAFEPDASTVPDSLALSAAGALGAILRNPDQVRSAIVLNEILTRPEHRW